MNKLLTLIPLLLICALWAGFYGILHDQLTYTISPEYYTKFKFFQFGLANENATGEAVFQNPRLAVAVVGFLATWWTGIIIGLGLGVAGLFHANARNMFSYTMKAVMIVLVITFLTGLIGLAYGAVYLSKTGVDWWLPPDLVHTKNFIMVGSMHNFGYLGAVIGMIAGITYQIIMASKTNPNFKPVFDNTRYFGLNKKPRK